MHPAYIYRGDGATWEIWPVVDGRPDPRQATTKVVASGPAKAMDRFIRDHSPKPGLYEVQPGLDGTVVERHGYVPAAEASRRHVK